MIVKVTQEHIDAAKRILEEQNATRRNDDPTYPAMNHVDGSHCPVAQAIHDIDGFENAHVERNKIQYNADDYHSSRYPLPVVAQHRIETYDETGEMEPFEFELSI